MQVYRIGPTRGAQRVGYARDPEAIRARMQSSNPEPLALRTWDLETGRAMLVVRLLEVRLYRSATGDGWFAGPASAIDKAVAEALADTDAAGIAQAVSGLSREAHARAMTHLRTQVFKTTQGMMGLIAGRSGAIVSRWEAGASTPGLDELLRLRAYARATGIPWEDALLLDPPQA